MSHVILPNLSSPTAGSSFFGMWALSRAIKKAGGIYRASGDGTVKDTSSNPSQDLWGGGGTVPGQTGSSASFTTKVFDDITVTGLTGMSSDSVGRFLTITGAANASNNGTFQIVTFVSASSVTIRNASGAGGDGNNGSIGWTEVDPALDSYPSALDSTRAWWVAEVNRIVRIPITSLPSGTFFRGEKVVQTNSNAEGEILGVSLSSPVSTFSYLVIQPRVGTFTANIADTITGDYSGATVNPSGSGLRTYITEIVFSKDTNIYNGWVLSEKVALETESAQLFSTLASTAAGCTATVAPGLGGAGNSLPTYAYAVRGNAGTGVSDRLSNGVSSTASTFSSLFHAVAADNIGKPGYSPDPTFWYVQTLPGHSSSSLNGFGFLRTEDTEPGDVDPHVWLINNFWSSTRTNGVDPNTIASISDTTTYFWNSNFQLAFVGWRRRGFPTGDTWVSCKPAALYVDNGNFIAIMTPSDPEKVASYSSDAFTQDPCYVVNTDAGTRCRKGKLRWLSLVPAGTVFWMWNSKGYVQVAPLNLSQGAGLILGPWDGTTDVRYALWPTWGSSREGPRDPL